MTEELPLDDKESYDFPDTYFNRLEQYKDEDEGNFCVVQGALYRALEEDARFSSKDAMQVSRLLNGKNLEEAEDLVYGKLEEEV